MEIVRIIFVRLDDRRNRSIGVDFRGNVYKKCYTSPVLSLHVIYASTSGHTEYVVETLTEFLCIERPGLMVEVQRAERAGADDLRRGDILLLASSTWNTGGVEGQLNPHMWALLHDRAKDADLHGRKVAIIALGDQRYHYTAKAGDHLEEEVRARGGKLIAPRLTILNEPWGQEAVWKSWGRVLLSRIRRAMEDVGSRT